MTSPLKAENETIDRTKFCPDCGQSLEYLGGDGLVERSGQCEVCAGEVECDRLNADREHERNMANEWLAKAHDAGKEVATLKADLSARMSQLNEARAATVEANMALADATEERDALKGGWAADQIDLTTLRRLLWLRHGCLGLYGDDGEMSCGECGIDFKRAEPEDIEAHFQKSGITKLAADIARKS